MPIVRIDIPHKKIMARFETFLWNLEKKGRVAGIENVPRIATIVAIV